MISRIWATKTDADLKKLARHGRLFHAGSRLADAPEKKKTAVTMSKNQPVGGQMLVMDVHAVS